MTPRQFDIYRFERGIGDAVETAAKVVIRIARRAFLTYYWVVTRLGGTT